MAAKILDGKAIANSVYEELTTEIDNLNARGILPKLSVVLVGDDPASAIYVKMKSNACRRLGIDSETIHLAETITEEELLRQIQILNHDPLTHGILVQMPLPGHIDSHHVIEKIKPEKDVDGFHPVNKGRLQAGKDCFVPCTPAGIQEILVRSGYSPAGKHVVVLGRSQIVGLPLSILLAQKKQHANATVTICHSQTRNLEFFTQNAEIVVAAMGKPGVVRGSMLKPHSVVIDVGVNRVEDEKSDRGYRLVGDVNFDEAVNVVEAITPVPGGVGPMTIAMLMKNTVIAAKNFLSKTKRYS